MYDQRRRESLKIMLETDSKRSKIVELLEFIEARLDELQAEKDQLREFNESDRERRCLEYAVYIREQNEAVEALAILEDHRLAELDESAESFQTIHDNQVRIADMEKNIGTLKSELALLADEKQQCMNEHQVLVTRRAQVELHMSDIVESSNSSSLQKVQTH